MSVINQLTKNFDAFLTATLEKYRSTLADNIFRSNVTLAQLDRNDMIKRQSGGNKIVQPLMYGENSTVSSYHGYEELDTTPQDGITAAEFDWKQIAGTVSISRRERRLNSGEEQLLNLLEKKIQQAEMSMEQSVNEQLINSFSEGNNGKDLTPVPLMVHASPSTSAANPVGEIDGSTSDASWWRNQSVDSSASDTDTLISELYRVYNLCARGGMNSRPDLMLADQETFEMYELGLDQRQRYINEDMADLGFENLRLKGGIIAWDEVIPEANTDTVFDTSSDFSDSNPATGSVYFLNSDFMEFVVDSETEFISTGFEKPVNQDAFVSQILFMGNMTISNRRKFGVLHNISRSLTIG